MARWRILATLILLYLGSTMAFGQSSDFKYSSPIDEYEGVDFEIIEVDTTLFRMPSILQEDIYSEATKYYFTPVSSRRRGLYYTIAELVTATPKEHRRTLTSAADVSSVTLYAAQSRYRLGARGNYARNFDDGWSLASTISMQSGRDAFTEGVYRNAIWPSATLTKRFSAEHFLEISAEWGYNDQGGERATTLEAYTLTGNCYYNPTWGLYDGKVRNSYTYTTTTPRLDVSYQFPVGASDVINIDAEAHFDRRSTSSLGWYNASTPLPDYYRKMPSSMTPGTVRDYVTQVWQTSNTDYTQVNWAELVHINSISRDGSARYIVESRIKQNYNTLIELTHSTIIAERLNLSYGISMERNSSRNYKEIDDLLGAEFLLDKDQFIGDSYNSTADMDNDIRNPDRRVSEGERFGYDYTLSEFEGEALLRAEFTTPIFDFNLEADIGELTTTRTGHYEKERFAGGLSYGASQSIEQSPYTLRLAMGYALSSNQYIALKAVRAQRAATSSTLLLDATMANILSPITVGQRLNSALLSYRFTRFALSLNAEIYAMNSLGDSRISYYYDDLSRTMCRAVIQGINSFSVGGEIVASLRLTDDTSLSSTIAAGRYQYSGAAQLSLYNEFDLSCIASPGDSNIDGVNIGNAPQFIATTTCTYYGIKRTIINISASYSSGRYIEPSLIRRSERLLTQAFINTESLEECTSQERLDDIFDVEVGATHFIYLEGGGRVMLRATICNLLGDKYRVSYARESDRVMLQSENSVFTGATIRASTYQYGAPRTILFSASYTF